MDMTAWVSDVVSLEMGAVLGLRLIAELTAEIGKPSSLKISRKSYGFEASICEQ
jgi:hypothetical protein